MSADTERRENRTLREILDDLVTHVRQITRDVATLSPAELTRAQERLEWLADEVWQAAVEGDKEL